MKRHPTPDRNVFFPVPLTPMLYFGALLLFFVCHCPALGGGTDTTEQVDGIFQDMGASDIGRDGGQPGRPIVSLNLFGVDFKKTKIANVAHYCQRLKDLNLMMSNVQDADLKTIARFVNLQILYLDYTGITDVGVIELDRLNTLKKLSLAETKVTDKGLEKLAKLAKLKNFEELNLNYTSVDGSGLRMFASPIRSLNLDITKVSDKSLRHLQGFKDLSDLSLAFTDVTDQGLKTLESMQTLKRLDLQGTKITDQGLASLARLKGLREIVIGFTEVTREGAAALQKQRANLKIEW